MPPFQSTDINVNHSDLSNAIRFLSVDAVQKAKSGHPGMPMGIADVATVLFSEFLIFDPLDPKWPNRDRFVLSAGHGSMLLYSLLYLTGYRDINIDDIKKFRQLGAKTAGHPEYGHSSGIETTTGPLGQGLGNAVGMALAERLHNQRFGEDIVSHFTYVIVGDGCLMEGISHEAISLAGSLCLSKLIVIFDDNDVCIDGPTSLTVNDDQSARFSASGWHVQSIDGHDPDVIRTAIVVAQNSNKPSMIACKTIIGFGSPNKAGNAGAHGAPLGEEEINATRLKLNWPHPPFEIPDRILTAWRSYGKEVGKKRDLWITRLNALEISKKEEFDQMINGVLPSQWQDSLNNFKKDCSFKKPKWATRKSSGEVLNILTKEIPQLIGGSADLTGSVNTKTPSTQSISKEDYRGRYVHYGVREHAMSAIMNGLALSSGFIPYGGTFLVFADYMRGGMRLSALMKQRVIYVLTHDSIGLGEDGPTHQAVETLATLRATPNFNLFRPCDPIETAECWALAIQNKTGPSGIVLTRQGVPTVRIKHTDQNLCGYGAYVLEEAHGGKPVVSILATGSEIQLALNAKEKLEIDGIPTSVISIPCWEIFDQQKSSYKEKTLGSAKLFVGVEAAVRMGWDKYIGIDGVFIGMESFGASAPAESLFQHFDITVEKIIKAVKARL